MLDTQTKTQAQRVAKSRHSAVRKGLRRVEVTIPDADAPLIRELASVLRNGGAKAESAKASLQNTMAPIRMRTGADLVALFEQSPLHGLGLDFTHERETGPPVDLFGET